MTHANGNGLDAVHTDTSPEPTPAPKPRKAKKAAKKAKTAAPKKAVKKAKTGVKKAKRKQNPDNLDAWGLRKGSIKSKAAAMYARKKGATLAEVKDELGSVQYNVIKQLQEEGFKVKIDTETNKETGRLASRFYLLPKK